MNKVAITQQTKNANLLPLAQGILERKCACGNHTLAGEECAACARKKMGLQRKLAIGAADDLLEQEADRIADQVMAIPLNSPVSNMPLPIQRFAGQFSRQTATAPASVDQVLSKTGRPLDPMLRHDMEQRFGYDFSRVRLHTDALAEQSAREVIAKAYTVGNDIVFGTGQFIPGTNESRRLLAHELTHVVQQSEIEKIHSSQSNGKNGLITIPSRPTEVVPALASSSLQRITPSSHYSRSVLQRDPERSTRSRRQPSDLDLRYMGRRPSFALHDWQRLNQSERDRVLWEIISRYGPNFALQFREYAYRRQQPNLVTEYTNLPSVTPQVLTRRGYHYAGDLNGLPTWVHPSGREVVLIPQSRRSESATSEEAPSPGQQENPDHINVPSDPSSVYGAVTASRDSAEVLGTRGRVVQYADGTVEVYPTGTNIRYTYRPQPGGSNAYDFYDENGDRTTLIAFDFDEVFGGGGMPTP